MKVLGITRANILVDRAANTITIRKTRNNNNADLVLTIEHEFPKGGGSEIVARVTEQVAVGQGASWIVKVVSERVLSVVRELVALRTLKLHHPQIRASLERVFLDAIAKRAAFFVNIVPHAIELFEAATLHHDWIKTIVQNEHNFTRLVHSIMVSIAQVHAANITHGDIKLENMLVDQDNKIVLVDYGFANIFDDNVYTQSSFFKRLGNTLFEQRNGTPGCVDPWFVRPDRDLTLDKQVFVQADIFAIGIVCFSIYFRHSLVNVLCKLNNVLLLKPKDVCELLDAPAITDSLLHSCPEPLRLVVAQTIVRPELRAKTVLHLIRQLEQVALSNHISLDIYQTPEENAERLLCV